MTTLSETHREIIIRAVRQIPEQFQVRFASNVVDALFAKPDLTDEDVRQTAMQVAGRMECLVRL